LELTIGIPDWKLRLGIRMEIGIGNRDWGSRIGTGDRNSELDFGIENKDEILGLGIVTGDGDLD